MEDRKPQDQQERVENTTVSVPFDRDMAAQVLGYESAADLDRQVGESRAKLSPEARTAADEMRAEMDRELSRWLFGGGQ